MSAFRLQGGFKNTPPVTWSELSQSQEADHRYTSPLELFYILNHLKVLKLSPLWSPAQLHFYIDKNISVRNDCGSKQELEHYSHNSEQNGRKDQLNDLMNKTTDQTVFSYCRMKSTEDQNCQNKNKQLNK